MSRNSSQAPIIIEVKPPSIRNPADQQEITIMWLRLWGHYNDASTNIVRTQFADRLTYIIDSLVNMTPDKKSLYDRMQRSVIDDLKNNLTVCNNKKGGSDLTYIHVNPQNKTMFPEYPLENTKGVPEQSIQTDAWIYRWLSLANLRREESQKSKIDYSKIRFTMPIFFRLENQIKVIDDIARRLFVRCIMPSIDHTALVGKRRLAPQLPLSSLPIPKANTISGRVKNEDRTSSNHARINMRLLPQGLFINVPEDLRREILYV